MPYKYFFILLLIFSCRNNDRKIPAETQTSVSKDNPATTAHSIGTIATLAGYKRTEEKEGSFANWLRQIKFKKRKEVYLYNGTLKPNQSAQFAVLDISTGTKDLQQCADVVMRLRAEYLFSSKQTNNIWFTDYAGKKYKWSGTNDRIKFDAYLQNVFSWCGSASLEKQLVSVSDFSKMQIGDVLIKGGFPGHAVTVVDMAVNKKGEKLYMLVQGYQPAQDMHVLVNPNDKKLSPWYKLNDEPNIYTPEWHFTKDQLRRWVIGN